MAKVEKVRIVWRNKVGEELRSNVINYPTYDDDFKIAVAISQLVKEHTVQPGDSINIEVVPREIDFPERREEMAKFRKKPVVIEATQWFKNGDHPEDNCEVFKGSGGEPFQGEGKVVRYYRRPDVPLDSVCRECHQATRVHGWIDTKEGGHRVCPGDWIITGVAGEKYPCKPDVFEQTYEPLPPLPRAEHTNTSEPYRDPSTTTY